MKIQNRSYKTELSEHAWPSSKACSRSGHYRCPSPKSWLYLCPNPSPRFKGLVCLSPCPKSFPGPVSKSCVRVRVCFGHGLGNKPMSDVLSVSVQLCFKRDADRLFSTKSKKYLVLKLLTSPSTVKQNFLDPKFMVIKTHIGSTMLQNDLFHWHFSFST